MEPGPLGSPLASGFLSAVCSRSSCSYRRLCSELQLGDLAHDVMGIDSVTETFFVEKPKPPVTQIPVALTRSFPTCNMINSQHHLLSPEKMFVLKGVIVTENDLGPEKCKCKVTCCSLHNMLSPHNFAKASHIIQRALISTTNL